MVGALAPGPDSHIGEGQRGRLLRKEVSSNRRCCRAESPGKSHGVSWIFWTAAGCGNKKPVRQIARIPARSLEK